MKFAISLSVWLMTSWAWAQALVSTLDLTQLHDGINAGVYSVRAELHPIAGRVSGMYHVEESFTENGHYCEASVYFPLGTVRLTLSQGKESKVVVEPLSLVFSLSKSSHVGSCPTAAEVLQQNVASIERSVPSRSSFTLGTSFLDKRRHKYEDVVVHLTPFHPGWLVNPSVELIDDQAWVYPEVIAIQIANKLTKLLYYTEGREGQSRTSLGLGELSMIRSK